jgi:hypothetical protein
MMSSKPLNSYNDFIFNHLIFEYKKRVRPLMLHTTNQEYLEVLIQRLNEENIDFFCHYINHKKVNLFFGEKLCIDVIKSFDFRTLSDLTPEQDFILGVLLGYDDLDQSERYLKRKKAQLY